MHVAEADSAQFHCPGPAREGLTIQAVVRHQPVEQLVAQRFLVVLAVVCHSDGALKVPCSLDY